MPNTKAHDQQFVHRYVISYPDHAPRTDDPHYKDFEAYRHAHVATARCAMATGMDDASDCQGGLELHHAHIEFALANRVDLKRLERIYPGVSNPDEVGAWVESGDNLVFLCEAHHRSAGGGVHSLSASDYEASKFIAGLAKEAP